MINSPWAETDSRILDFSRRVMIGLEVSILRSPCASYESIGGRVADETRNVLTISTPNGTKKVPKDVCYFRFKLPNNEIIEIEGSLIVGRVEDRVKMRRRRGHSWRAR